MTVALCATGWVAAVICLAAYLGARAEAKLWRGFSEETNRRFDELAGLNAEAITAWKRARDEVAALRNLLTAKIPTALTNMAVMGAGSLRMDDPGFQRLAEVGMWMGSTYVPEMLASIGRELDGVDLEVPMGG